MKTILVTGSAGFIGYHTAKKLLDLDFEVIGIDNLSQYYGPELKKLRNEQLLNYPNYKFHQLDIRNYEELQNIFEKNTIDTVCHLAAQAGVRLSLENPLLYAEVNVLGTTNVFELSKKYNVGNVVYASSSSVYGGNKKIPFSEKDRVDQPISPYGVTKKANELLAYTYHHLYGMHFTGLRFFTAYGPWGRPDMAYFKFAKAILEGKTIDVYNNGKSKRDFTYIDDIVDGIVASLEKSYPLEIINLGNSQTIDLNYFIQCLEEGLGKKAKKNYLPLQAGDLPETFADISKAKKLLNFNPKIKFNDGITKFLTWYLDFAK